MKCQNMVLFQPAHIRPVCLTDDQVGALHPVPPNTGNSFPLCVSPRDRVTSGVSLDVTGQPGCLPGLDHDGAEPACDSWGGAL